ncbi:polyketide synthase dehydratase domain-containing protein, partial [Frankia sp. AiPs1]
GERHTAGRLRFREQIGELLGAASVRLDPAALPRLESARPASPLAAWAAGDPLVGELMALLDDTAETAASVLASAFAAASPPVTPPQTSPSGAPTREVPAPPAPAPHTATPHAPAPHAPAPHAPAPHAPGPHAPAPNAAAPNAPVREAADREAAASQAAEPVLTTPTRTGAGWEAILHVSLRTMPHLLDHALNAQRPGWPDDADRRPVVAATTTVQLMMDAAERASGRIAVGLADARFDAWLPAAPAREVTVRIAPVGPDRLLVTFVGFASAEIVVADRYPASRPARWPVDPAVEQPPIISARDFYRERWMFHGPAFQGVTALLGHSVHGVRAVLTGTRAPGSLLDAAGQLLGYWIRTQARDGLVLFPVRIGGVRLYGPEPAPGVPVTCQAWVTWVDDQWVHAHLQLVDGAEVWAEVEGWVDRRFGLDPALDEAFRHPDRHPFALAQPGGWVCVTEQWSDLATRELVLGSVTGAAERADHDATPPPARRAWLLRRIAAKDAVRIRLWAADHGPLFPAELHVTDAMPGAAKAGAAGTVADTTVIGAHGGTLAPFALSVAHGPGLAVAIARPATLADGGVGIALARIDPAEPASPGASHPCGPDNADTAEGRLLRRLRGDAQAGHSQAGADEAGGDEAGGDRA